MRSRARSAVAAIALSVLAVSVTAPVAVAESSRSTAGVHGGVDYVALGDSYTSGPLVPFQRLDPLGCARSTNNYPSLLARQLHVASFRDVSCGGADTADMTAPQSVPLGLNPPQFDALDDDTDLVTVGIGGNDNDVFGRIVGTCPALRAGDPTGSPCREQFTVGGVDTIKAAITSTGRSVAEVVEGIHDRAPRAHVVVVGYPRIAPPAGTCPAVLPFADGDYRWLDSVEHALNGALAGAAAEHGASFVDMYPPSLGHDACAGGAAWIQGKDIDLFGAANYHPRRSGMEGVATAVATALRH